MERAEVVLLLQDQCALTEEQANDVIAYGLAHALLVEDLTNSTQLQVGPNSSRQR